jgi:hypothetical protein
MDGLPCESGYSHCGHPMRMFGRRMYLDIHDNTVPLMLAETQPVLKTASKHAGHCTSVRFCNVLTSAESDVSQSIPTSPWHRHPFARGTDT